MKVLRDIASNGNKNFGEVVELQSDGSIAAPGTITSGGVLVATQSDIAHQTITPTMASGASIDTGYSTGFIKTNGLVVINTRISKTVSTTGYSLLFTLPIGNRPKAQHLFPYVNESGAISFGYIDTGGNCYVYYPSTANSKSSINITFSV